MIPLMIKYHLNLHTTNILKNFINDDSYFITPNTFYLNYIKIGPFASEKMLEIKINDFINTKFKYEEVERNSVNENDLFFYIEVTKYLLFIEIQVTNSNKIRLENGNNRKWSRFLLLDKPLVFKP